MASGGTANCSFKAGFAPTRSVIRSIVLPGIVLAAACSGEQTHETSPEPCSEQWQQSIEARLHTGDSQGHGPDVGSAEWFSVVEFKLGIRGKPEVPSRDSLEWCTYIDDRIGELGG
jgi:hypothetical protein